MTEILNAEKVPIRPLSTAQIEASTEETTKAAVAIVENGNVTDKNLLIEKYRKMLSELNATKSKDESSTMQTIKWSTYYLADRYPLTVTAVAAHTAIEQWVDTRWATEECDADHVMIKWAIFGLTFCYLTFMGLKTSAAKTYDLEGAKAFIREFGMNWVVLPLMLMSMVSLPPLKCYVDESAAEYITLCGTAGVIALGIMVYVLDSRKNRSAESDDGSNLKKEEEEAVGSESYVHLPLSLYIFSS